jgi:hypothetical protein
MTVMATRPGLMNFLFLCWMLRFIEFYTALLCKCNWQRVF